MRTLSHVTFFRHMMLSASFILLSMNVFAQNPVVTVRFANPEYVSATQTYNLDVEFMCNTANKQLFGMNVRFFYPDDILEFITFGEFAQGYSAVNPNPPVITTGNESGGMILFGFPGPQEYLNGAIQKTSTSSVILSTTSWTKIFNASFHVDDTSAFLGGTYCPSVIWDLNEDANGGIAAGICITVVVGSGSGPSSENCEQFNWQYDGIPGLPHGFPVNEICTFNNLKNVVVPEGFSICEDAVQTITVAGDNSIFIVEQGADVTLIAGQNILLLGGTMLYSGSHFLGAITINGNYCGSLESAMVSNPLPQDEVLNDPDLKGHRFKIYPNPTSGRFTLFLDEPAGSQSANIQVIGMLGSQILNQKLENSNQFEFDLSDQKTGIYMIRLIQGEEVETMKLFKQ